MKKITLILILTALSINAFISCKKNVNASRDVVFNISSTIEYRTIYMPLSDPVNSPTVKIVENGRTDTTWMTLGMIEGFTYMEGYKYRIKVRISQLENPPMDGSSVSYKLLSILSKEKVN